MSLSPAVLLLLAGGLLGVLGGLAAALRNAVRADRLARRIRAVRRARGAVVAGAGPEGPMVVRAIAALGNAIGRSGLLSARTLADFEQTLAASGFRRGNGLGLFIGSKLVLMAALPLIALLLTRALALATLSRAGLALAAAVIGMLAPDFGTRWLRRRYVRRLQRGLPDALDLMVICSEAGLALEATINRVAIEIRHAHPEVAQELDLTAHELRIITDSRIALQNAGARTGLEDLKRLGTTLIQTIQYGTPLSQALRTLAAEMRQEMLARFEARAARLPVLLTLPMIVFILPCVFLVVAGPAILQVVRLASH